jgi:hypothetical protein
MRGFATTTDDVKRIDAVSLRKAGYLRIGKLDGMTLSWSRRGEPAGAISADFQINIWPQESFVDLHYVSQRDTETEKLDYKVNLLSTFCRYGGMRWWFECPHAGCQRRVRILYQSGKYFVCRKCARLWYDSQRYVNPGYKSLINECKADGLLDAMKRRHYRGKPTRKYRRYLRLSGVGSV